MGTSYIGEFAFGIPDDIKSTNKQPYGVTQSSCIPWTA